MFRRSQSVDVVAVEMRDHHHVDRLRIEAGGHHIGGELPDIALALRYAAAPLPVSITTSLPPVLITRGAN